MQKIYDFSFHFDFRFLCYFDSYEYLAAIKFIYQIVIDTNKQIKYEKKINFLFLLLSQTIFIKKEFYFFGWLVEGLYVPDKYSATLCEVVYGTGETKPMILTVK